MDAWDVTTAPFRVEWWQRFVAAWNTSAHKRALAGLGTLRLAVSEAEPVFVRWDSEGSASLVAPVESCPALSAAADEWWAFLGGDRTAVSAVLSGRLRLTGSLAHMLPYAAAFDRLGEVARSAGLVPHTAATTASRRD